MLLALRHRLLYLLLRVDLDFVFLVMLLLLLLLLELPMVMLVVTRGFLAQNRRIICGCIVLNFVLGSELLIILKLVICYEEHFILSLLVRENTAVVRAVDM